ncbi:hypothetical protein SDC9_07732 [bioreactor metagenome]|uniref:Uncharacterized protein n=1 Tax=bioreactor metagenome TaxID=1076179 RepID=A0A644T892_9ZZZZ|nr:hypothetical protein [Candidatus Elulimicrobiales bacterium]
MRITRETKEEIISSFKSYLANKGLEVENIFLFFAPESFKNFLLKFEPDISDYSSVKDVCKFLSEKQIGDSVLIAWNQPKSKIGEGIIYIFSPCKLIKEKKNETEDFVSLVICGWNERFLLKKK